MGALSEIAPKDDKGSGRYGRHMELSGHDGIYSKGLVEFPWVVDDWRGNDLERLPTWMEGWLRAKGLGQGLGEIISPPQEEAVMVEGLRELLWVSARVVNVSVRWGLLGSYSGQSFGKEAGSKGGRNPPSLGSATIKNG